MKNRAGFTLVEILLVIFLIAMLSTVAISNYMSSTKTFNFLSQYKQVMSVIRTARSYALTNKEVANPEEGQPDILPERYGVYISAEKVFLFADVGTTAMFYDSGDVLIGEKNLDLKDSVYVIGASDSDEVALSLPVVLFYKTGMGDLEIREKGTGTNDVVEKSEHKCISFDFRRVDETLKKYIVIFQVSGLAEEFNELKVCAKSG